MGCTEINVSVQTDICHISPLSVPTGGILESSVKDVLQIVDLIVDAESRSTCLNPKFSMSNRGRGVPTFDTESKSA